MTKSLSGWKADLERYIQDIGKAAEKVHSCHEGIFRTYRQEDCDQQHHQRSDVNTPSVVKEIKSSTATSVVRESKQSPAASAIKEVKPSSAAKVIKDVAPSSSTDFSRTLAAC